MHKQIKKSASPAYPARLVAHLPSEHHLPFLTIPHLVCTLYMDDSSAAFLVYRFTSMLFSDTDEHLLTVRESLSKCQQPSYYLFAERKKGMKQHTN